VRELQVQRLQDLQRDRQRRRTAREEPTGRAAADVAGVGQALHAVQIAVHLPRDERPAADAEVEQVQLAAVPDRDVPGSGGRLLRHCLPSTMLTARPPAGARTATRSPTAWPISAWPSGLSTDTRPERASASAGSTMVSSRSPSSSRTRTHE